MTYILLGAAGFLLMHLLDFASIKKAPFIKPALSFFGTMLIAVSATMVAIACRKFGLPEWASIAGWAIMGVSAWLTVYSLYFALPAVRTYIKPGSSGQLVTRGVYALVRHPWLLFFALSMTGLALGSRSILAVEAGIAWTILSLILVYVQDRKIFPHMFSGYAIYQKTTPMIVPNRNSVSAFFEGFRRNKLPEA
ncbi:methyltransferase family protein [Dehalogenimonas etheniformans]|uniref:NnrU domain-containing protein n=1 Tax=Dehalogenimonas etheniformans TaxID=1536648 RepID=A0A2P5P4V2_9CHLR|nr:methyltransferase [Dehalogenimonas etheniformans]PPD57324.1 hypothetical protein JP09_009785 [Dehalogenimonas etheniformans]QNT77043.1 hypothetical protein HX448_10335 [Dehalogenimonas etheniformans]